MISAAKVGRNCRRTTAKLPMLPSIPIKILDGGAQADTLEGRRINGRIVRFLKQSRRLVSWARPIYGNEARSTGAEPLGLARSPGRSLKELR
jgi:hypothetical protein